MTTARDIVTQALREGGILALGETAEAASLEEGLQRLNVLLRSTYGFDVGESLKVYNIGLFGITTEEGIEASSEIPGTYYIPSNSIIHANLTDASAVYLDPNPEDGARIGVLDVAGNFGTYNFELNANGKKIAGGTYVTLSTNGELYEYFYRADLGEWLKVSTLAASDAIPFPPEFDDYFITLLAFRLSRRYGQEVSPEMMATMTKARSQFRARYSQIREKASEAGWRKINPSYGWDSTTNTFNRGRLWNY